MTFGLAADFSEEAFVGRLNADLANDLGNLVARATTLIVNYQREAGPPADAGPEEAAIREAAATARGAVEAAMDECAFQRALAALWEFIGAVNRYVDANQPWALAKDPAQRPRLDRVLVTLADSLRYLGVMLTAFLPDAATKIRAAIGHTAAPRLADAEIGGLDRLPAVQKLSLIHISE